MIYLYTKKIQEYADKFLELIKEFSRFVGYKLIKINKNQLHLYLIRKKVLGNMAKLRGTKISSI